MNMRLRQRLGAFVVALMLPFAFTGCGVVIVAGLGALGGYAVSRDTIEGITGYSEQELISAGQEILSIMGSVTEVSKTDGRVSAVVDGARVSLNVIPVSRNATKLRVKARRGLFPKIAIAQDVYMKVLRRLQE